METRGHGAAAMSAHCSKWGSTVPVVLPAEIWFLAIWGAEAHSSWGLLKLGNYPYMRPSLHSAPSSTFALALLPERQYRACQLAVFLTPSTHARSPCDVVAASWRWTLDSLSRNCP